MFNILLVDDEFTERDGMKFLIEKFRLPLNVAEAENGKKALEYILRHQVDILLTDVRMPYMDGLELAREVSRRSPDTVIIIFSAYSEFEYARKACEVHAVHYLLKPIELDEFEQVMNRVIQMLEEREAQRTRQEGLRQAEKKYLLYQMFQSRTYKQEYAARLKAYDINLEYRHMVCISIETVRNYFELYEEALEQHLASALQQEFELISLCPNQAFLLLYSFRPLPEDRVQRIAGNLYHHIIRQGSTELSVIIGKSFYGIESFPERVSALEELRSQLFSDTFGIRREIELSADGEELRSAWSSWKESILKAVEQKELALVRERVADFLRLLEQTRSASAIYTKYVLVDIFKAVFSEYGIYNQDYLLQATDQIMRCASLKDMEELLNAYLDEMEKQAAAATSGQSTPISEIRRIVSNEYMTDLSLEVIAAKVCLAPGYVSYIFKQETGQNLIKYLTDYRMEKAMEFLRTQNDKITDIAKACGYQNQSYFNKLFKNYYGITPKQFREKLYEK